MGDTSSDHYDEAVRTVFAQCQQEFQTWKQEYCRTELDKLDNSDYIKVEGEPSRSEHLVTDRPEHQHEEDLDDLEYESDEREGMGEITVWQFDANPPEQPPGADAVHATTLSVPVVGYNKTKDGISPVPPYESCTPILHSISMTGTAAERDLLEFEPFADEPEFGVVHNIDVFYTEDGEKELAWRDPNRDPDRT